MLFYKCVIVCIVCVVIGANARLLTAENMQFVRKKGLHNKKLWRKILFIGRKMYISQRKAILNLFFKKVTETGII